MPAIESTLRPKLKAPAGTCDTHMHVYDPKYPKAPTAKIDAPAAPVSAYRKMCARLGIERTVVVQPSTYGKDNRCTLEAVAEIGPNARCVVVVDQDVTDAELDRLTKAWRTRHPLLHAGGRTVALGRPRNNVGARGTIRLARSAAARRPRPARTCGHAQTPDQHAGDRSCRKISRTGAARSPGISRAARAGRRWPHLGQTVGALRSLEGGAAELRRCR